MEAGSIVISKAGRDKGKRFIVLRVEGQFAYLADGDLRKAERPKKKKIKHIQRTDKKAAFLTEKLQSGAAAENFELRRALSEDNADQAG